MGCLLLPSRLDAIENRRQTTFNFLNKAKSRRLSMEAGDDQMAFHNLEGQQTEESKIIEQMVDIEDSLNLIQVGSKRNGQGGMYAGASNPKKAEAISQSNKSASKSKSNML